MANLSYDLHIHSCLSPCGDDDMTPGNIVGMAKVIGLDVVALTDHSTCKNCPAFAHAAEEYGITPIFGMELTTMEEVHVLCYFSNLEDAMNFDAYVYEQLPDIPNTPAFFGNQLICDENDLQVGTEPKLLISSTMIPFDEVYDLVSKYHGIMVPAHITKSTTSIMSNLGFIPPDSKFQCVELADLNQWEDMKARFPYLESCNVLCSSDAHDFNSLHEPVYFMNPEANTSQAILQWIQNAKK